LLFLLLLLQVNFRDDRVEWFGNELQAGKYVQEYVLRATHVGRFMIPPARAAMMFRAEIFGQSTSNIIAIN
jgi:uncharacterized protein YfaS (alpha-2-macroglobulin family)